MCAICYAQGSQTSLPHIRERDPNLFYEFSFAEINLE